jgi:signal transduction histidine kinase
VERENGSAIVTVEDNGPGIDPDLRDRVFERFVRGSGDSGRSFGLGLSIVRAVAESHGGSVRVESPTTTDASIARGTRFVVTLPVATREPAATT